MGSCTMGTSAPNTAAVVEEPRRNNEQCTFEFQDEDLEAFADTQCGLCSCHPASLQRFASKKMFVLVLGLLGLASQSVNAYSIATLSTIEKRFKIPSQTSGFIACFWDVGEVTSLLAVGYLGGRSHKPRLLALGALLMTVSCLVRLVIHVVYGPGNDALALTKEFGDISSILNTSSRGWVGDLCLNETNSQEYEDCYTGEGTFSVPTLILVLTTMCFGVGTSTYLTLGLTYIDDNSNKAKSPLALAVSMCLRLIGPTLGFGFATYSLAIYVEPSVTPLIENNDPRWIGAWWIGYVPGAVLLTTFASLMMLFPKQLPREALRRARASVPNTTSALAPFSFKDFKTTIVRLFRNPVFTLNSLSGVCFAVGFAGYGVFMPKYMETQYRQSASAASFISGAVGLIFTGLGLLGSGVIAAKFRPSARALAMWSVFVEVVNVIGHFTWAFLTCGEQDLHGSVTNDGLWNLTATCNAACNCGPEIKYDPVCSSASATTFYSPCHAGCTLSETFENGTTLYSDCSCATDDFLQPGSCPRDCGLNFVLFLATQCAMRFLEASGLAGNIIIQFRCVEEADKSMSIAVSEFMLAGLAFIPGPVLYGMLLDSTCLVWGERCGGTGNCWIYDDQKLRYQLNFTAAAWLLFGMILDIGVWYYSKDLKIYDEDGSEDSSQKRSKTN